jgi:hypothetical protein
VLTDTLRIPYMITHNRMQTIKFYLRFLKIKILDIAKSLQRNCHQKHIPPFLGFSSTSAFFPFRLYTLFRYISASQSVKMVHLVVPVFGQFILYLLTFDLFPNI